MQNLCSSFFGEEWMEEGGAPASGLRFVDLQGSLAAAWSPTICSAIHAVQIVSLDDCCLSRGLLSLRPQQGFKFSLVAGDSGVKAGDILLRVPDSLHISPSSVRSLTSNASA